MISLNNFSVCLAKRVRVGRGIGSGLGKTCGKGHKGQKSRSGYSRKACFEGGQTPLNIRLPKFGFTSLKMKYVSEMPSELLNSFTDIYIDLALLKERKIINNKIKYVKIFYSLNVNRAVTIDTSFIGLSKQVVLDIESNGGKILLTGGGGN